MIVPFAQFSLLFLLLGAFHASAGEVRIVTNAAGEHTLLRDGVPYIVRGACWPVETTVDELRRHGWIKPYLHTEFGPLGYWPSAHNRPPTAWGAAIEQTSSEKAGLYAENWLNSVNLRPGQSFGGYAFIWSWKQERTHTWYSMFMPTGERTELVDAMRLAWTGQPHPHLAPRITRFETGQPLDALTPGESINVHLAWTCDRPARLHVETRHVPPVFSVGGDFEKLPDVLPTTSWHATATGVSVTVPSTPGEYRIFFYIKTDDSTVATANLPILVKAL